MQALPFGKPGQWYRGCLHTHSTRSDGKLPPEQVIAAYRAQGYDFMSITDHFLPQKDQATGKQSIPVVTDTTALDTADFVTIPGAEIHGPGMGNGENWHIVAVGLPPDFAPWTAGESGPAITARAYAAGAFVAIAHPNWNTLSIADAMTVLDQVHAVEIYNHGCAVEVDRGDSWHFTDVLLGLGHRLTAIATDDAHAIDPPDPVADAFGGWVHVRAASLQPVTLLEALHAGHFYSSTGPEIHDVHVADGNLTVRCSPASAVIVTGSGSRSHRQHGTAVQGLSVPVERFADGGFCRVTVIDEGGKRAWTNPIWLD